MNVYVKVRPDALNGIAEALSNAVSPESSCATCVQRPESGEGADDVIDCDGRVLEHAEAGGGGGNRTPVPWHRNKGVYVCSLPFNSDNKLPPLASADSDKQDSAPASSTKFLARRPLRNGFGPAC